MRTARHWRRQSAPAIARGMPISARAPQVVRRRSTPGIELEMALGTTGRARAPIAKDVADLHGDTIDQARIGNNLSRTTVFSEKGETINGAGSTPNEHDMLTGSQPDGRAYTDGADHTCSNWTSNASGGGRAQLGHFDRTGGGNTSWNSAHPSRGMQPARPRRHGRRRQVLLLRGELNRDPRSGIRDPLFAVCKFLAVTRRTTIGNRGSRIPDRRIPVITETPFPLHR